MEISFASKKLKDTLEDERAMEKAYGTDRAKALMRRLDDLAAAEVLADMRTLAGRCEELKGSRKGQFSIRLTANWRLIFTASDSPPPLLKDGGMDWNQIQAIEIKEIIDYHG